MEYYKYVGNYDNLELNTKQNGLIALSFKCSRHRCPIFNGFSSTSSTLFGASNWNEMKHILMGAK